MSPEVIAEAVGSPLQNVQSIWPHVEAALQELGMDDLQTQIAAAATIAVETRTFLPIRELGGPRYLDRMYEGRADLGNTEVGDGARFCGRGLIQITGRANYRRYGAMLGVDLLSNPDAALRIDIAAPLFAAYFRTAGVPEAAKAGNWTRVRKLVNGGTNHLNLFLSFVDKLQRATAASEAA